jgi:anti-sigma-K factor RskA
MFDDDQDALAAEYVLGTLSAKERDQAETLLALDPGFAKLVGQWESRLGELNVMVEAVDPPPGVWEKIRVEVGAPPSLEALAEQPIEIAEPEPKTEPKAAETEALTHLAALASRLSPSEFPPPGAPPVKPPAEPAAAAKPPGEGLARREAPILPEPSAVTAPAPDRSVDVIRLRSKLRRARAMTIVFALAAAALAAVIAIPYFAPGALPFLTKPEVQVVARGPATAAKPEGSRLIAALQQGPIGPAFLVTVDVPSRTLTVRRLSTAAPSGRSYELWLIAKQFATPRSLGVVGNDEFTQRPLPANLDIATLRDASYAVSLEPQNGSPSGAPTGPVLFTGKLVDSLPGSPS